MNICRFAVTRPVAVTVLMMVLVLFGLFWFFQDYKQSPIRFHVLFFRHLQKASSEVVGNSANMRDRHGVPFLAQFFGTAELTVSAGSRWDGCPIATSGFREEFGLLVLGVARSGKFTAFPDRDFVLRPEDRIMLIGEPHACDEFCAAGV